MRTPSIANLKFYTCILSSLQIQNGGRTWCDARGKRWNSGRKRKYEHSKSAQLLNRQYKQIYLSLTIFKSWKDAKNEAGYDSSTDSEFAAHLLSLEYCRRCA